MICRPPSSGRWWRIGLLVAGLAAAGCAGLPRIRPAAAAARLRLADRCAALLPARPLRAVHAIDAELPLDGASSLLGVSLIDPSGRRLRAVLISVEGLTLFDASAGPAGLRIHRAVPPLDDPEFGLGLVADVGLLLLRPPGEPVAVGRRAGGRGVCRYRGGAGGWIDLLPAAAAAPARIERWGADRRLRRSAELSRGRDPHGLARRVELSAPGLAGYRLVLELLEAEPLNPTADLFR